MLNNKIDFNKSINKELMSLYWDIGKSIVEGKKA